MPDNEPRPLRDEDIADYEQVDVDLAPAKSHVFSIRLNADEMTELARAAGRAQMKLGSYIKRAALKAARSERLERTELSYGSQVAGVFISGGGAPATVEWGYAVDEASVEVEGGIAIGRAFSA